MSKSKSLAGLLAEFFIIVIGVLVALGVDRWASAQEDRAMESRYLEGFASDLGRDSVNLERLIELWAGSATSGELLLQVVRGDELPEEPSLFELIRLAGIVNRPTTAVATYEDLIASGNLGLVRDRDLRIEISEYYRARPDNNTYFERLDLRFRTISREILPPRLAYEADASGCTGVLRCTDPPGFDRAGALQRLVSYPNIEDLLRSRIRDLVRGSYILQQNLESTVALMRRLETAGVGAT